MVMDFINKDKSKVFQKNSIGDNLVLKVRHKSPERYSTHDTKDERKN